MTCATSSWTRTSGGLSQYFSVIIYHFKFKFTLRSTCQTCQHDPTILFDLSHNTFYGLFGDSVRSTRFATWQKQCSSRSINLHSCCQWAANLLVQDFVIQCRRWLGPTGRALLNICSVQNRRMKYWRTAKLKFFGKKSRDEGKDLLLIRGISVPLMDCI